MDAHVVNFTLYPMTGAFAGSEGGYRGYLEGRPTYTFDMLLAEVKRRHPSTDPKQLRTDAEHLFDTAASVAEEQLVNVQFGDYILLRPYMGGKFKKSNSQFNPAEHSVNMRAICRKELKIDFSQWTFHNATNEKALRVDSVNSVGADRDTEVTLNLDFEINGNNTNLLADLAGLEPKDRVEFACTKPDGTKLSGEVEVVHSSLHTIVCRWPAALDASTVGGTVMFVVYGRCNDPDAFQQTAPTKEVVIVAGETPPGPTPTGPTVTAINSGTFLEGGGCVVHGENMRFADEYPGNHVIIKDSEGTDMGAMISTDESIPVTEESFGLTIDAGTPFTEGAEYVFAFAMLDADGEPVTVTQTARYVSE